MNMDLEQEWKNMGTAENTYGLIEFPVIDNNHLKKTASPMYKIKKSLEIGMYFIIMLLLAYIAGIVLFKPIVTKCSLLVLAAYNVYCLIQSLKLHKQIYPFVIPGNSLKAELERHYSGIMCWCKSQERIGIFLYPVSLFGGAILGISVQSTQIMNRIMHNPLFWIVLTVIAIILVPLAFVATRRLMKAAYYDHLRNLKHVIESIQNY